MSCSGQEIVEKLTADVRQPAGDVWQYDDMTLVVVKGLLPC